jgi:hypothetical protein
MYCVGRALAVCVPVGQPVWSAPRMAFSTATAAAADGDDEDEEEYDDSDERSPEDEGALTPQGSGSRGWGGWSRGV